MPEDDPKKSLADVIGYYWRKLRAQYSPEPEAYAPWVPDAFPMAKRASFAIEPKGQEEGHIGRYNRKLNTIYLNWGLLPKSAVPPGTPDLEPWERNALMNYGVPQHETGHAVWRQDLTREQKDRWEDIHNKYLHQPGNMKGVSVAMRDPSDVTSLGGVPSAKIPDPIAQYPGDPSHSFAEAFGQYVRKPEEFKSQYPDIYAYFSDISKQPAPWWKER